MMLREPFIQVTRNRPHRDDITVHRSGADEKNNEEKHGSFFPFASDLLGTCNGTPIWIDCNHCDCCERLTSKDRLPFYLKVGCVPLESNTSILASRLS